MTATVPVSPRKVRSTYRSCWPNRRIRALELRPLGKKRIGGAQPLSSWGCAFTSSGEVELLVSGTKNAMPSGNWKRVTSSGRMPSSIGDSGGRRVGIVGNGEVRLVDLVGGGRIGLRTLVGRDIELLPARLKAKLLHGAGFDGLQPGPPQDCADLLGGLLHAALIEHPAQASAN